MGKITTRMQLDIMLLRINEKLGRPVKPYVRGPKGENSFRPAPGNIFLDNAYGGYSIREMMESGGERCVVTNGYFPKKQIMHQLEALEAGISLANNSHGAWNTWTTI